MFELPSQSSLSNTFLKKTPISVESGNCACIDGNKALNWNRTECNEKIDEIYFGNDN